MPLLQLCAVFDLDVLEGLAPSGHPLSAASMDVEGEHSPLLLNIVKDPPEQSALLL